MVPKIENTYRIFNSAGLPILMWVFKGQLDKNEIEDIASLKFSEIYSKVDSGAIILESDEKIYVYIFRSIFNECLSVCKKKVKNRTKGIEIKDDNIEEYFDSDRNDSELKEVLRECLLELEEEDREVLMMFYFYNLNFKQISVEIGKKAECCRQIKCRAIKKLRNKLRNRGYYE